MGSRILLLSANFGSGHLQAAHAIAQACEALEPSSTAVVVNIDHPLLSMATAGYLTMLHRAPGAFRTLYNAPVHEPMRALIRTAYGFGVRAAINRLQPTAIIATHPFPGSVAARLRRQGDLQTPVAMAITDFLPHQLWVDEGVSHYFVPSAEAATRLASFGVDNRRVTISGIPIRSGFGACTPQERPPGDERHVLVMGGGLGLGPIVEAVRSFAELPQRDLKVTVICGKNERLLGEMTDLFQHDRRIDLLGQTDQVAALMNSADLLVSKPGGLSCSEALACGLPLLLLAPLPGHEEENADYLVRTGAALLTRAEMAGRTAVDLLYRAPVQLRQMRTAAQLAGQPLAARRIAEALLPRATAIAL